MRQVRVPLGNHRDDDREICRLRLSQKALREVGFARVVASVASTLAGL